QTHSVRSSRDEPDSGTWAFADRWRRAWATATPYPVVRSMPNTAERPKAWASIEPLRSVLPVSTATTRCTDLVCLARASMTRGSHAAPSWATITAVTMSGLCVLSGDTFPLAARSGHLPRHAGPPPGVPARLGHALNNTRTGGGRAGRRRKIARGHAGRLACGNWLICWSGEGRGGDQMGTDSPGGAVPAETGGTPFGRGPTSAGGVGSGG